MDIKLKRLLLQNNFQTLNALAKKLSIDNSALAAILSGARHGYKHRDRIAKALHVKVDDLFGTKRPTSA